MLSVTKGDVSLICNLAAKFVLMILLRLGNGVEEVKPGRGKQKRLTTIYRPHPQGSNISYSGRPVHFSRI